MDVECVKLRKVSVHGEGERMEIADSSALGKHPFCRQFFCSCEVKGGWRGSRPAGDAHYSWGTVEGVKAGYAGPWRPAGSPGRLPANRTQHVKLGKVLT